MNVQEKFFAWLKGRVSSAELSTFYVVCKDIESFFMNKNILTQPLFETTDTATIQSVIDTIKSNRMFQFRYFGRLGKMRKVMDYYMSFLLEVPLRRFEESELIHVSEEGEMLAKAQVKLQSTILAEQKNALEVATHEAPAAIDDKIALSENVDFTKTVVRDEDIMSKETDKEVFIWNFAGENVDFPHINPTLISYFGDEEEVRGWMDAYVKIFCIMQDDYPSIVHGLVGFCFDGARKVILTDTAGLGRFSKPVKLHDDLYLETDCSPDEIISIVRVLMDKCNMDYDNIEISYEVPGDAGNESVSQQCDGKAVSEESSSEGSDRATKEEATWCTKDIIVASGESTEENSSLSEVEKSNDKKEVSLSEAGEKVTFENWLVTDAGLTEGSAQSYSSAITIAGKYAVNIGISDKELYFILDAERVYQISTKLLDDAEFKALNKGQHNLYRVALSKYWDYCNALAKEQMVEAPTEVVSDQEDEVKKNRVAFIAWAQAQQMRKADILIYLFDIKECSEFAQKNNYIEEAHVFLIQDATALERVFLKMQKDKNFITFNIQRQKRPASAMKKLIAFRRDGHSTAASSVSVPKGKPVEKVAQELSVSAGGSVSDPQVKERYSAVLAENFVDGFRPKKTIDRDRFRMYYGDMFGEELTEDDECLIRTLMKVGTLRDERIFVQDATEQRNLLDKIDEVILKTFEEGASCIYLDCLFAKFQEQLAEMLHIYNVDSLGSVLFSSGKRDYFKRYNYLFGYNKEPAPKQDVIEYMKGSHLPVTYSEIEKDLWYIPLSKIKRVFFSTPSIVNVASETYLYAPNLPVSEQELQQIAELIRHALLQRSYILDVELMQLIEKHCPSVLMNTSDYPVWGIRNALAYFLREKFVFQGAIISNKGEEVRMSEVFSDFCQRYESITIDELKNFAKELNTEIYWESVYGEMIRISKNEFMRRDQIHFDVERTDSVLDSLIQGDYTPIKEMNLFLYFPPINIPWNSFVLESYVANYSEKFRLLHVSYTSTGSCGAIVRKESDVSDYRTLIVDVLAENPGWNSENDALQLLVDLGYQQKKSYSDIAAVVQEAKTKVRGRQCEI